MRPGPTRAAAVGSIGLLAIVVAGCAKKGPPSGGPPDLEPPRVISSVPDSGASRVALEAPLAVTFSEGMEPRSAGDAVAMAPRVEFAKRRWSGRTLTLVPAQRLRSGQTYTLFVGGTARDRHGNTMGTGAAVVFSTADSFPKGRIEGELEAHGFAAPGTYLWCYDAAHGREPDSTAGDFDALGLADRNGRFRVDGLAVPGRYRLWAFADLNANRSFEPTADILAPADTTIELTPERPVASGLTVRVVNPRAPASVKGTVVDSLGDSLGVLRVVAVSEQDSTLKVQAEVAANGDFELDLDAGSWRLRAFRDLDKDRLWKPEREPASAPLPLRAEPAAEILDLKLVLRRAPG